MRVEEDATFSREYLEADKRSIANAITIEFRDGTRTERIALPIGSQAEAARGTPLIAGEVRGKRTYAVS